MLDGQFLHWHALFLSSVGLLLSWTDFIWLFRPTFFENLPSQMSHLNVLFPSWTDSICLFSQLFVVRLTLQMVHSYLFLHALTEYTVLDFCYLYTQLYYIMCTEISFLREWPEYALSKFFFHSIWHHKASNDDSWFLRAFFQCVSSKWISFLIDNYIWNTCAAFYPNLLNNQSKWAFLSEFHCDFLASLQDERRSSDILELSYCQILVHKSCRFPFISWC